MRRSQVLPALIGVGCFALLLGASGVRAQTAAGGAGDSASAADKMFVKKAMAGGMAEVELGQLAAQKGSSEDVKKFGQMMVDDHTKLNDQMKPIASQLGVTAPAAIPPAEQALETRLKGLSGDAFDKAYMRAMLKDHRQDLMEFKKEASTAKSPEVKDAASQGEQVITQHLKMAESVAKKVGATGTATAEKSSDTGK